MDIIKKIGHNLEKIKEEKPLVHCITNYITANDCANALLAIGASPTMANNIEEVEEIEKSASALVLNMGTLGKDSLESMIRAGKAANKFNVPIVLDPVGIASISYRRKCAITLLEHVKVNVIRGNISEIKALCGLNSNAKGVDSNEVIDSNISKEIAKDLSRRLNAIIAITGEKDYISNGEEVIVIKNGHKLLTKVTGTGCMTTCLIGAYIGVNSNCYIGTIAGVLSMGIAGEIAFERLKDNEGSGSYRVKIIDALYNLHSDDFIRRSKIHEQI